METGLSQVCRAHGRGGLRRPLARRRSQWSFQLRAPAQPRGSLSARRSDRQLPFTPEPVGAHDAKLDIGARKRAVYVTSADKLRADSWLAAAFTETMKTPDSTLIFITAPKAEEIRVDQTACMGCLSA